MVETHAPSHLSRRRMPRWAGFVLVCLMLGVATSVGVAWGVAAVVGPILPTGFGQKLDDQRGVKYDGLFVGCESLDALSVHPNVQSLRLTIDGRERTVAMWVTRRSRHGLATNVFSIGVGPPDTTERQTFYRTTADPLSRRAIARHTPLLHAPEALHLSFTVVAVGWPWPCMGYEEAFSPADRAAALANNPATWRGGNPTTNLRPYYGAWRVGSVGAGAAEYVLPLSPMWGGFLANALFYGAAWAMLLGSIRGIYLWFVRRRHARGGCPSCGYSREGLKDGAPCPECGRLHAIVTTNVSTDTMRASHDGPSRPEGPRDLSPE